MPAPDGRRRKRPGNYGHSVVDDYGKYEDLWRGWEHGLYERRDARAPWFQASRGGMTLLFGPRRAVLFLMLGLDEPGEKHRRLRPAREIAEKLGRKPSWVQSTIGQLRGILDDPPLPHDFPMERMVGTLDPAAPTSQKKGRKTSYHLPPEVRAEVNRLVDDEEQEELARILRTRCYRFRADPDGQPIWLDICECPGCREPRPEAQKYCHSKCGQRARTAASRARKK